VIKHIKVKHDFLNSFSMMYLNSVLLIPVLFVASLLTGEFNTMRSFAYISELNFLFSFTMSSLLAFVLNYAIFWNTSANSALTQTVSGQIKDIGTVLLGYLIFPPKEINWLNLTGVSIGFVGSLAYAYQTYRENVAKELQKQQSAAK